MSARTGSLPLEVVEAFRSEGHVLIDNALDPAEVEIFRPYLVEATYGLAQQVVKDDRAQAARNAFINPEGIWHFSESARRFVLNPRLAEIAAQLLGVERVRIYHDQAFFKPPSAQRTPWHQDLFFWPLATNQILTIWVPLMTIEPAMGGLLFLSRSHRLGHLGNIDSLNHSSRDLLRFVSERGLDITERGAIPPGSISVHHGWTVHGALPNSSQVVREAVTIIYYADGAYVDDPPLPDNPSPYELRAAYTRRKEMEHWLPGLKVGDRAVSRENPLVFDATYSR